ncbi:carbohydrate ABC transporter permease [Microcella sp.]|uniref:carbohydrate ABC transporter permease n=1 Tax=Microcella sp. TaxID=1913979 RepID=UPI00256D2BCB|nr:sugar ABC transporter permease [Microcella sp.]MBX9471478.1 sugar ABC transporter permease [Microcella sp.]
MFTPYLALLLAFGVWPIVVAAITSFEPSILNPGGGPLNYLVVLQDFRFLPALINVGIFLAMYVPAMLIVVALMSLLLDTVQGRWNLPLRLTYLVPASLTGATAVLVWYFLLEPTLSPYQDALAALGITQGTQIWQAQNLGWIFVLMAFFTGAGNWIVVQYGSLQSIPDDILEAARIDGANAVQIAWQIKLPLIKKYLVYMGILVFAAGLQVFVEPQLISASVYPGLAANWSLNQLAYTFAFQQNNLGGAAALSLMLLVVCVIAAVFVIFRTDFFDGIGVKRK